MFDLGNNSFEMSPHEIDMFGGQACYDNHDEMKKKLTSETADTTRPQFRAKRQERK